jgi:hypothetical protein
MHAHTFITQAMLQDDILCLVLSHPAIKQFMYTPRNKSSPETLRTPPEGKTRTVFTVRYRCLCEIISCGNGGGENNNCGHSFLHLSIFHLFLFLSRLFITIRPPLRTVCRAHLHMFFFIHVHCLIIMSFHPSRLNTFTSPLLYSSTFSLHRGVWGLRELCE